MFRSNFYCTLSQWIQWTDDLGQIRCTPWLRWTTRSRNWRFRVTRTLTNDKPRTAKSRAHLLNKCLNVNNSIKPARNNLCRMLNVYKSFRNKIQHSIRYFFQLVNFIYWIYLYRIIYIEFWRATQPLSAHVCPSPRCARKEKETLFGTSQRDRACGNLHLFPR